MSIARSITHFVMGPGASPKEDMGIIPAVDAMDLVGFSEYNAARPAGITREPKVSVPMENGEYPAATAIAEPLEDPPGFWRY
jgi:hypothetical protein